MAKQHPASLLVLACLAALQATVTEAAAPAYHEDATTVDWARGAASWQLNSSFGEEKLWTQPNYCDTRVLHSSAPLTVLFGVSTFWDEIKHRRASLVETGNLATDKPLEVHVLGAAYPFEGRSDWSLLASRRPADVPGVRVVLVLGTPWHMDNVPTMTKAKEFDEQRSFLFQVAAKVRKPETGKFKGGAIKCANDGSLAGEDESFRKADLCRDHGNGLEVVCVEKYYQDVQADLPKPDVVAMFSPGFPQIARRSWDQVLRSLLATEVPIMVCDLLYSESVDKVFVNGKDKSITAPGKKWSVKPSRMEDGMTLRTMRAYGARKLGSYRNPFPILIKKHSDDVTAKNAVLQVFRGRLSTAKPFKFPSEKAIERRKKKIAALDLQHLMDDESSAEEIKTSMLIPTSKAYDKAMWQLYRKQIREWVEDRMSKRSKGKPLEESWISTVEELGLTGKQRRRKPWKLNDWIFVLSKLKVADEFF